MEYGNADFVGQVSPEVEVGTAREGPFTDIGKSRLESLGGGTKFGWKGDAGYSIRRGICFEDTEAGLGIEVGSLAGRRARGRWGC